MQPGKPILVCKRKKTLKISSQMEAYLYFALNGRLSHFFQMENYLEQIMQPTASNCKNNGCGTALGNLAESIYFDKSG